MSWTGTASAISNPEYEWALFHNLCLNDGITVVLPKSNADIGSPKYRILLGSVTENMVDTVGLPNVFDCTIPYGLLPSFLLFF